MALAMREIGPGQHDQALMQQAIEGITERLAELGLSLVVERDFERLRGFLSSRGGFVNPSFDPTRSDLGRDDFWLAALDPSGRIVASSAERVLETGDLGELVATGRLWYREGFAGHFDVDRVPVLATSRHLHGRISHSGSTFVDPMWRRCGLALYLAYLSRAISFRDSACSLNTGFVRHSLYVTPVPTSSYGYVHVEKILDGYFPPQHGSETLYVCWIDRPEFLDKIRELPSHPRHPVTLTAAGGVWRAAGG
jgi:hypothetical protein